MVFNQTEKQERSYLQQIITRLKQIISHTDMSVKTMQIHWRSTKTTFGTIKILIRMRYAPCVKAS